MNQQVKPKTLHVTNTLVKSLETLELVVQTFIEHLLGAEISGLKFQLIRKQKALRTTNPEGIYKSNSTT